MAITEVTQNLVPRHFAASQVVDDKYNRPLQSSSIRIVVYVLCTKTDCTGMCLFSLAATNPCHAFYLPEHSFVVRSPADSA